MLRIYTTSCVTKATSNVMPMHSTNPATGKLLRSFDTLSPEALEQRLKQAASAARTYPREPVEQRSFWMRRLALLLESDAEELAALMTAEMGKTLAAARAEVAKCATACRYYADNAEGILADEPVVTEHAQSFVRWQPLGVVLAVMPWNFPLWQVFRFAAPALMAGNVGLLKHASNVPQCALAIETLIRRAGFPRGVFQTLLIESRQVEQVLADERVAAVTVTGSEAAGRAVAAQAGWLIKKTVLELGGSDPFIVMPTADFDEAVQTAVHARCVNNGQSCIAAKRFFVHDDIYDAFESEFVAAMEALRVGDPMDEDTDIGPLATAKLAAEVAAQVRAAVEAGGRLLTGGERMVGDGNYFEPAVIAGVPHSAAICREEIFGPVALLFRVDSAEEALTLANDSPFGLGASVWSNDADEQEFFATGLQTGAVFLNAAVASDVRLPFGGIKRSGYGRELSAAGMREFMNAKTIVSAARADTPLQEDLPFASETPLETSTPPQPAETEVEEPRRGGGILGLSRRPR
jgi:succinate-semialdehyde dehydrogenase/glutarate-semialdehyde dehydrogenase